MAKEGVDPCPTEASIIPINSEVGLHKDGAKEEHQKAVKDKGKVIIKSKLLEEDHQKATKEKGNAVFKSKLEEGDDHAKAVKDKGKAIVKFEQEEVPMSNPCGLLDFMKLPNHNLASGWGKEINFLALENVGLLSGPNNMDEGTGENSLLVKTFSCRYCKRQFSSIQALGGHQNAHKPERELEKRLQEMERSGAFGEHLSAYPHYSYPSFSSPHYKTYHRALGVRMDSMIQKPVLNGWTVSPLSLSGNDRFGHGHGDAVPLNPERLRVESLQARNNGGLGRLLKTSANNPRLCDDFSPIRSFGESSSFAAAAANSRLVMNNLTSTATEYCQNDNAEILKSWGRDLSLKL